MRCEPSSSRRGIDLAPLTRSYTFSWTPFTLGTRQGATSRSASTEVSPRAHLFDTLTPLNHTHTLLTGLAQVSLLTRNDLLVCPSQG
jgi:hypothetical protein